MNKTKIEWCDYSINPVKGLCPMGCEYCYARRMYKRFKWNPEIRFDDSAFRDIDRIDRKQGQRVFVGSTIELFWDWIPEGWMKTILEYCHLYYHTTFIFLTKQPQNLIKWTFPDNCWVGVSVDGIRPDPFLDFAHVRAGKTFASFEPLLAPVTQHLHLIHNLGMDWVIIGQQTPVKKATMPKIEWIEEIIRACDKASIPVFLKNNLFPLLPAQTRKEIWGQVVLRQEFPCL